MSVETAEADIVGRSRGLGWHFLYDVTGGLSVDMMVILGSNGLMMELMIPFGVVEGDL